MPAIGTSAWVPALWNHHLRHAPRHQAQHGGLRGVEIREVAAQRLGRAAATHDLGRQRLGTRHPGMGMDHDVQALRRQGAADRGAERAGAASDQGALHAGSATAARPDNSGVPSAAWTSSM